MNYHVSLSLSFFSSLSLSDSCSLSESVDLELELKLELLLELELELNVGEIKLYVIALRAPGDRSLRSLHAPLCPRNASLPSRHGGGLWPRTSPSPANMQCWKTKMLLFQFGAVLYSPMWGLAKPLHKQMRKQVNP